MAEPALAVSLNEVEALAAKATRGAGAPWGVADDVARAARWLASHGLDWSGPLLILLRHDPFAGVAAALTAADRLEGAVPGEAWSLGPTPLAWTAAILSAALHGRPIALRLVLPDGAAVYLTPTGGVSASAPWPALPSIGETTVQIEVPGAPLAHGLDRSAVRMPVPRAGWEALGVLAMKTTVPASAASRATGAGGDRVDAE